MIYGTSNLRSVARALEHVVDKNIKVIVSGDKKEILSAERVVFPGQGAIGQCMQHLQEQALDEVILECIQSRPYLGICLGLQGLMQNSEEDGGTRGLAAVAGEVLRFKPGQKDSDGNEFKIPHMGWNQVKQTNQHPLWQGIENDSRFYFVHSYYVKTESETNQAGISAYNGIQFTAALAHENIFATQFHPEKSQKNGLQLLQNFSRWQP